MTKIIILLLAASACCRSQTATVAVNPEADAYVWSEGPTNNYGGAGAIAISGAAAVNETGQQNGSYDSLIRFPMSNAVAVLDAALNTHDWLVLRATLSLTELGAPPYPGFNRGVGAFEVRWIASGNWIEGTGIPKGPTMDGVAWNDLPSILNAMSDASLGQFTNSGVDARLSFDLALKEPLLSAVRSGTRVNLYLTAVNPQIGFTAGARTFFDLAGFPSLVIVAAANPHPRIDMINSQGTNAVISFSTVSNWTYVVQGANGFSETWSNLLTVGAQSTNGHVLFTDPQSNEKRFYRLSVSR